MKTIRVSISDKIGNLTMPDVANAKTAIHLPGLPNTPLPVPGITDFLVECGYAVLQPHYTGTYDSGGAFDPYESFRDIQTWASAIESGMVTNLQNNTDNLQLQEVTLLSCHSFGSYTGMKALRHGFSVEKAIFFGTSFTYGEHGKQFGVKGDKTDHSRFVERAYPRTFRVSEPGIIEEFFVSHRRDTPDFEHHNTQTRCVAVVPDADPTIEPAKSKMGVESYFVANSKNLTLDQFLIARESGHAVAEMLTSAVKEEIRKWLNVQ